MRRLAIVLLGATAALAGACTTIIGFPSVGTEASDAAGDGGGQPHADATTDGSGSGRDATADGNGHDGRADGRSDAGHTDAPTADAPMKDTGTDSRGATPDSGLDAGCSVCGCACDMQGGSCVPPIAPATSPECVVSLASVSNPESLLAIESGYIYAATAPMGGPSNGSLWKIATSTPGNPILLIAGLGPVIGLAVDTGVTDLHIYWTTSNVLYACSIGGCLDGGTEITTDAPGFTGLAVANNVAYFGTTDGFLFSIELTGSMSEQTLAAPGRPVENIAVDTTPTAYFTTALASGGMAIWSADSTAALVADEPVSSGLALTDAGILWTTSARDGGTVSTVSKTGANLAAIVGSIAGNPAGIATDGAHVYWTTMSALGVGSGTVMRANMDGSNLVTIAAIPFVSGPLVLDDSSVYFLVDQATSGSVVKLTPK
jgi:hypothetical protein